MNIGGSGYGAWLLQRVSAVYMTLFLVFFISAWLVCPPGNFVRWSTWMTSLPMALATTLFFLALLGHAWVGMRDVLIDYLKPVGLRFTLLAGLGLSLMAMALWVVKILLMGRV